MLLEINGEFYRTTPEKKEVSEKFIKLSKTDLSTIVVR